MNLKMTEGKKVKKALLVIDMQNVCVGKNHAAYFKYDNEILIQTVNEVIVLASGENNLHKSGEINQKKSKERSHYQF